MATFTKVIILIVFGGYAFHASAKSIFEASNGDTVIATISSSDLTRIEIDGQKIVKDFSSANISKKITQPLGQVYLIPNTKSTFNLYVVSNTGNTYNLKLTPSTHVTGDSIVIKPISSKKKSHITFPSKNETYVRNINYLLETMFLNTDEDSQYTTTEMNLPIITYDHLDSVLLKRYTNDYLVGMVLLLKNTSSSKISLTESDFYSDHTLAVAIENPNLMSNDFTRVFIIQEVSSDSSELDNIGINNTSDNTTGSS